MTRGDEAPAAVATHKDPGQPAEPAQQQEKAADTQAAAERTEYPFGEVPTNQESKFFRSRVRVLPEMKGDAAWEGEVYNIPERRATAGGEARRAGLHCARSRRARRGA